MTAGAVIDELLDTGIRLSRDGDGLVADVLPGASLDPYREEIRERKPDLVKELLQREIVAAASAEPEDFDRDDLDRLWTLWHEQNVDGDSA